MRKSTVKVRIMRIKGCTGLLAVMAALLPAQAMAYIGPGAGLSTLGTVIAFFGAILLLIVGFVWYPIKRLLARFKKDDEVRETEPDDEARPEQPKAGAGDPPH